MKKIMRETRLETVIEQVKRRRCRDKKPWIYDKNGEIKSSVIVGDVLPLLEEMKEYEINVSYEYIEDFFKKFNRGDTINGNTYNSNACISNDIDWKALETEDNCFFLVQIHLFGDICIGYSDWFVLKMDSFHEFWELENWLQYKTINDRYSVNIYLNQECYELIDNDTQENLGEYYSMKVDDLLTEIAEKGKEIE